MNLLVLGATGATGRLVVDRALADGHRVTALVRSPDKLTRTHPNLHVVSGSVTDSAQVAAAMQRVDAVISTLGATKGTIITDSTRAILAAAPSQGVTRVVQLSTFAVQRDRLRPLSRLITQLAIGPQLRDKTAAEDALRASGLDWTLVHASVLTNGSPTGTATPLAQSKRRSVLQKISRADVAKWLVATATTVDGARGEVALGTSRCLVGGVPR